MENTNKNTLTPKQIKNQHKQKAHIVLTDYLESFGKKKRVTPEREVILDIIYNTATYITISEIESKIKARNGKIAQSAIYKIINFLMDLDLIVEIPKSKNAPASYTGTIGKENGITLRCLDCGKTTSHSDDTIKLVYEHIESFKVHKVVRNAITIPTRCQMLHSEEGCHNKKI